MKKNIEKSKVLTIFICIVIFCIGVAVGSFINKKDKVDISSTENKVYTPSAAGVYHSYSWNNSEATLVLNEDGTCKYPTGTKGTWREENGEIVMELEQKNYSGVYQNDVEQKDIHNATIVNNGIILHDKLFEKMK